MQINPIFTPKSRAFSYGDTWRVQNFSYYVLHVFLLPFLTSSNLWLSPSTPAFLLGKTEDLMIVFKLSRYHKITFQLLTSQNSLKYFYSFTQKQCIDELSFPILFSFSLFTYCTVDCIRCHEKFGSVFWGAMRQMDK